MKSVIISSVIAMLVTPAFATAIKLDNNTVQSPVQTPEQLSAKINAMSIQINTLSDIIGVYRERDSLRARLDQVTNAFNDAQAKLMAAQDELKKMKEDSISKEPPDQHKGKGK